MIPCPLEKYGGVLDPANGVVFFLLETLMQQVGADAWGNPVTWLQLPIGRDYVNDTLGPRESMWRMPMLLSAAGLWHTEQQQAVRRFTRNNSKRTH